MGHTFTQDEIDGLNAPWPEAGVFLPEVLEEMWRPWEQQGGSIAEHVNVSNDFEQHVRRLNVTGRAHTIRFRNLENVEDINGFVQQVSFYCAVCCLLSHKYTRS